MRVKRAFITYLDGLIIEVISVSRLGAYIRGDCTRGIAVTILSPSVFPSAFRTKLKIFLFFIWGNKPEDEEWEAPAEVVVEEEII